MNNKLIYKFTIGIIAALLWSFLGISIIVSKVSYKTALKDTAADMYRQASTLSGGLMQDYFLYKIDSDELDKQLQYASSQIQSSTIIVLSPTGKITYSTDNLNLDQISDFDTTETGSGKYSVGDFYGAFSEEHINVFYPVQLNFTNRGYLVISTPTSVVRSDIEDQFNLNYLSFAITLAFFSIIIILFIKNISLPLKKINEATDKYAKGEFSHRINMGGNDEITRLANSLDYMAGEIQKLNEYQQKFVANVSHDLRSPLTSIKGYLEAMLDGTIPPELYDKYLNIVVSETERLTKLTNNLLTMNTSASQGMILECKDFDICAVIKTTIQTYEGVCMNKNLRFKLVFSDKSLMVYADKDKITQVINNLVDNAIKFSNTDSAIIISATEKNDKVIISVKDFGIGIPKDSISKIWDRFYKTDLSRGKDKKGTGLGLSIVKDIITAHKEYIDVTSTEGVGTEFSFGLPKSRIPDTEQ